MIAARRTRRPKYGNRLEKHEQADIVRLLETVGAKVYVLGTKRKRGDYQGTMQTPGVPDLYAFLPPCKTRPYPYRGHALWIEVKSRTGRLGPEQRLFRDSCTHSVTPYVSGCVADVAQYLRDGGWLL